MAGSYYGTADPDYVNSVMAKLGNDYRVPVATSANGGAWSPGQPLQQSWQQGGEPSQPVKPPNQGMGSFMGNPMMQGAVQALGSRQQAPQQMSADPVSAQMQQQEAQKDAERQQRLGKLVSIVGAFFTGGASMAGMAGAAGAAKG